MTNRRDWLTSLGAMAAGGLAASSLQARDSVWDVRSATGLGVAHHGAAIISIKDGRLIGQLLFDRGKASIATVPAKP